VSRRRVDLLAVDAGGSKVDAAAVTRGGAVLAHTRVGTGDGDPAPPGHLGAVALAIEKLCVELGLDPAARPLAGLGVFCLADADLPSDDRRIMRAIGETGWTDDRILRNDTFAILRAGTDRRWGVAVVCGHGTNCSGLAPDGRTFRMPALGMISGDWGGGGDLGEWAMWHAIRSEDGRGERTVLERTVPAFFDLRRPRLVMEAIHFGRLPSDRLEHLAPLVFEAAAEGDAVARALADRQADEIATMAGNAIRRLRMQRLDVPVVLGGGVFRNRFGPFYERIESGIRSIAPSATMTVLASPPVVGAALIGLDALGATRAAERRVRSTLTHDALGPTLGRRREG
jgi:N-acetylglucosamine kinase-like BadF-type ATPase